jgi:hypothetical protein
MAGTPASLSSGSWSSFEAICRDILDARLGVSLELFALGADQGIDLRYFAAGSGEVLVVQCRHWIIFVVMPWYAT